MPAPISSTNSPSTRHADAMSDTAPSTDAPVVTIPPVYIEGDAGNRDPSVKQLVKAHDAAASQPNCRQEVAGAAVGTIPVVAGVLGTAAAIVAGPLAVAAGLATLFGASIYEGKELRALHDCKNQ